jgi:hypothetical protein
MKGRLVSLVLLYGLAPPGLLYSQTLDKEMSGLAGNLSKALVAKGSKNVAALDFTDLQGQMTEMGRFLSEHLTVEMVSIGVVSMVDRANLKSILAEHKLTEEGLVNPVNAKKLGEFAGVDAILIGNTTTLDDGIVLIVKAISTDSARIIAAGEIKFPKTSEIQQLLNRGISSNVSTASSSASTAGDHRGPSYQEARAIATKDAGSLRLVLKSVSPITIQVQGHNQSAIRCSFDFINRETARNVSVAMNSEQEVFGQESKVLRSSLLDERGRLWALATSGLVGIGVVGSGGHGYSGREAYSPSMAPKLLERWDDLKANIEPSDPYKSIFVYGAPSVILPGQGVNVTMTFIKHDNENSNTFPKVFQLDGELVVGIAGADSTRVKYVLVNLTFDRVSMPTF